MKLLQPQAAQFGQPQAGGVGEFEHGLVAKRGRRGGFFGREELVNFVVGQRFGQAFPAFGEREMFGGIGGQKFFRFRRN